MKTKLTTLVQEIYPEVVTWRHGLHRHPEVSRQEFATSDFIEETLKGLGLEPHRVDGTGVVCDIEGQGEGPLLLLRGDTDALPINEETKLPYASVQEGTMHACGHDFHTAALLGAGKILAENRDLFRGTVRLCFQHAEEVGHGAKQFLNEGWFEGGDACFAMHVYPTFDLGKIAIRPGAMMASVDYIRVTVQGESAHVASPHEGIDALTAATEMITALQQLVSRHSDPFEPLVLGIGKMQAGTAYNIVAEQAVFEGTLRCLEESTRERVLKSLREIVEGLAAAYGAQVTIEITDYTDVLFNDEAESLRMMDTVSERYGEASLMRVFNPSLAGEDFALFAKHMPGCMAFVGTREENRPETHHPLHSRYLGMGDSALQTMIELHLSFVANHAAN